MEKRKRRIHTIVVAVAVIAACLLALITVRFPPNELEEHVRHAPNVEAPHEQVLQVTKDSLAARSVPHIATSLRIGGKERGPSGDLITGDGFRLMSDFVFDETTENPAKTAHDVARCVGSEGHPVVVFVQTHLLSKFLELWLPLTHNCRIRLVTHNSDYSSPWEASNTRWKGGVASSYADQRRDVLENADVELWFAQNAVVVHSKLQPIPIGIENRYNKYGAHYELYAEIGGSMDCKRRPGSVFVSFNVKTNPRERGQALQAATSLGKRTGLVTIYRGVPPKRSTPTQYRSALSNMLAEMCNHEFVLAPHGHGVDTHRLWEALYAGCIPIVLRSAMDHNLLDKLPVLLIDDYAQINASMLRAAAERLTPRWAFARSTMLRRSYWETVFRK